MRRSDDAVLLLRECRWSSAQEYDHGAPVLRRSRAKALVTPIVDRLRAIARPAAAAPAPPASGGRPASVLLLCDPSTPGVPLLFVLRSPDLRAHPGQIAFPGGSAEPDDADVVATALREANEELGVDADNVEILGLLSPFATVVSDRWLTPVIGLERGPSQLRGDGFEIAEWFRIDIAALLVAPHSVRELERDGVRRRVHFYEASQRVIWGVTGGILHELLVLLGRTD
jgi:8-oxo-dGTP pyrophosphatase MutT (NUDIX family)